MHGSDPLDHDPEAEEVMFHDLICAAENGSDGQDKRKRGAAAEKAFWDYRARFGSRFSANEQARHA